MKKNKKKKKGEKEKKRGENGILSALLLVKARAAHQMTVSFQSIGKDRRGGGGGGKKRENKNNGGVMKERDVFCFYFGPIALPWLTPSAGKGKGGKNNNRAENYR